jgi:hypothetical protein
MPRPGASVDTSATDRPVKLYLRIAPLFVE